MEIFLKNREKWKSWHFFGAGNFGRMTLSLDLVMGSSLGAMEADEVLNLIDLFSHQQLTNLPVWELSLKWRKILYGYPNLNPWRLDLLLITTKPMSEDECVVALGH